jgi:hypothetical protein
MNYLMKITLAVSIALFACGAPAQTWTISIPARTGPSSSTGANYTITKTMTVGTGACGGVSYLVGIPDTGTSDYTATEADHIANWLQVYKGFSKLTLVAPASITYNCFPYAMGPSLVWAQDFDLLGCVLDSTFTEVGDIQDAEIVVHYSHRNQEHEDMDHASKVVELFNYFGYTYLGVQGKYGAAGVYKTGIHFPAQFYGNDMDDDLYFTSNP